MKNVFLLYFFLLPFFGLAQFDEITEDELDQQSTYINAVTQFLSGNEEEAVKLMEKFVEENPTEYAAYFQLAKWHRQRGQLDQALSAINRASSLFRGGKLEQQALLEEKWKIHSQLGNWELAAESAKEISKTQPLNDDWALRPVDAYLKADQPEKALEWIDKKSEENGFREQLLQKKLNVLQSLNRSEEVEATLRQLAENSDRPDQYYTRLFEFYEKTGQTEKQDQLLNQTENNSGDFQYFSIQKAKSEAETAEEFLSLIQPLLEENSVSLEEKIQYLTEEVSNFSLESSKARKALHDAVKRVYDQYPDQSAAMRIYIKALLFNGQIGEALEIYPKYLDQNSSDVNAWVDYLKNLNLVWRFDQCLEMTEEALLRFPNKADIFMAGTYAAYRSGDFTMANNYLAESRFMVKNNQSLSQKHAALSYLVENGKEGAECDFFDGLDALKSEDYTPSPLLWLAMHCEVQDPSKLMEQSIELSPTANTFVQDLIYAWLYYKADMRQKAISRLESCKEKGAAIDPRFLLLQDKLSSDMEDETQQQEARDLLRKMGFPVNQL